MSYRISGFISTVCNNSDTIVNGIFFECHFLKILLICRNVTHYYILIFLFHKLYKFFYHFQWISFRFLICTLSPNSDNFISSFTALYSSFLFFSSSFSSSSFSSLLFPSPSLFSFFFKYYIKFSCE